MMIERRYRGGFMRRFGLVVVGLCVACILSGCSIRKESKDKIKDLDFTVIEKDKVPDELKTMIEEKKQQPFKLTYADQGWLYIAEGYGAKETSGYSIEVKECYEAENAVYIHTNLNGPAKDEKVIEKTTYPYVVVKLEFIEKNVVYK